MNGSSTLNRLNPLVIAIAIVAASVAHAEDTANVQTLPVITVEAEEDTPVTEGTGSYTAKSANTATKLNLSLRETPQSVKVYTREYLDDRNIESFQELLTNVTGVSGNRWDERLMPAARGFALDYYLIDGVPSTMNLSATDLDLGIYDRVEVVKGANGLMVGAGNPAMGFNMILKRANSKELTGNVTAQAGSWNNFSSSADISTPLNADASLRGRIFVKNSQEDSYMDFYERDRRIAYGAIDYDITDKTTFSVAATYQELERNGVRWGGLPAFYTDGTRTNFDRSLAVSADWTFWNVDSTGIFTNFKQNLYQNIDLNIAYSYRRDETKTNILYTAGQVDKATNTTPVSLASAYSDNVITDENNVDVYISAPFTVAGRKQEVVVGGSWNKNEGKKNIYGGSFYTGRNVLNVDALNYGNINTQLIVPLDMTQKGVLNETTQSAAYISGKFHLFEPVRAVAGARLSNWESGVREFENELTPYIGIIYDFAKDYSLYASYTSIFKPQSRKDVNGIYLDPIEGKSYETGIKAEFLDGHLNAALSLFRIEQTNVAEVLLNTDGTNVKVKDANGNPTAENAYYGAKGVESEGVELNIEGEINDNWSINFGVANFEAEDAKGNKIRTTDSRTTADIFVKYKNDAWFAGAGVNYYSKIYTGTGAAYIDRDDIYLANAMLGYKFDQNISAQFNVNNIFDKKYYDGIGANSMVWGEPRNATLTLRYQF